MNSGTALNQQFFGLGHGLQENFGCSSISITCTEPSDVSFCKGTNSLYVESAGIPQSTGTHQSSQKCSLVHGSRRDINLGSNFPQRNIETDSLMKTKWKIKEIDSWLLAAAAAQLSSGLSPCFCTVNLLGVIFWKVPGTWFLTSAKRAGATAPCGRIQALPQHHSALPCDEAKQPMLLSHVPL